MQEIYTLRLDVCFAKDAIYKLTDYTLHLSQQ